MKRIAYSYFILFAIIFCWNKKAFATQDCLQQGNAKKISIYWLTNCASQIDLDSIAAKISLFNTSNYNASIFINCMSIGAATDAKPFITIAYDTLRDLNSDYIFETSYSVEKLGSSKLPILDINATNLSDKSEVGIKIIYNSRLHSKVKVDFEEINRIVKYAVDHIEEIKKAQKRITVPFHANGYKVSMVTLDTDAVWRIANPEQYVVKKRGENLATSDGTDAGKNNRLIVFIIVVIVGGLLVFLLRRKKK